MRNTTTDPDDFSRALSRTLHDMVREAGLTHRVVSERTGIPMSTLYRRLAGRGRSPYINEVEAIVKAVGADVVAVFERAEAQTGGTA